MAKASDWEKIIVDELCSFEQAIQVINAGGYQLCLICSPERIFRGIITDSDIRKALLDGRTLKDGVHLIMNPNPLVAHQSWNDAQAERQMHLHQYMHLPIVDADHKLIGLQILEQFNHRHNHQETLVIMAGGKGTRLLPLTKNIPKPMLPIQGKPMLEHIIERARLNGFKNITISVNYLSQIIVDHFKDGNKYGVKINYLFEDKPLGTAGALAPLKKSLAKNEHIIVTNGDIWTDLAFSDFLNNAKRMKADVLVATRTIEHQVPFGVISTHENSNKITSIDEKPMKKFEINAGIYALNSKTISLLDEGKYMDMPDLISQAMQHKYKVCSYNIISNWTDIGRINDYNKVSGLA